MSGNDQEVSIAVARRDQVRQFLDGRQPSVAHELGDRFERVALRFVVQRGANRQ